jgi:hypothetical protein
VFENYKFSVQKEIKISGETRWQCVNRKCSIFSSINLDPFDVGDCFALELYEEMPNDPRLTKFSDYLVENYISEEALFPPIIWAENSATSFRTTNECECFHSHFNNSIY